MEEESHIGISSSTKPSYQEHCDLGKFIRFHRIIHRESDGDFSHFLYL